MTPSAATDPFYFTPGSAFWEMNRERVLLLSGGRTLLMQIAHPMVAEAVYNHSYVFEKPLLRLQRTLNLTFALVYGTKADADAAVAEIERAHRPAAGRLDEAVGKHAAAAPYNARNPRQGLWVYATLVEGAISAYETFVAPAQSAAKSEFYAESRTFAQLMGVPASYLPADYDGLLGYMQSAIDSGEVRVGPKAREIAPFITGQSLPILKYLLYPAFRMTVGLLPQSIRAQYGYPFGRWEERLLNGFTATSRAVVPLLPGVLRFVEPYRRAMRRVR